MTDIKEFFIASNTVSNAPDYDSNVLSTLIHTVESFARVTYQSIYLIDYYKQEFLYVSDNEVVLSSLILSTMLINTNVPCHIIFI